MRVVTNSGGDRVIDELRQSLQGSESLDLASPQFSLFAFAEMAELLGRLAGCRLVLPDGDAGDLELLGGPADRPYRNRLIGRWLAQQCADWLEARAEVKTTAVGLPQSMWVMGNSGGSPVRVVSGICPFTTEGLGLTPGNQVSLIQAAEDPGECATLANWFAQRWNSLPTSPRLTGTDPLPAPPQ